jgi:hypothetical protein
MVKRQILIKKEADRQNEKLLGALKYLNQQISN